MNPVVMFPPMGGKRGTLGERFWRHVRRGADGECWPWTATKLRTGYGTINTGDATRTALAHRVCWTLHHGAIPEGKHVLHTCDNPSCVNPRHLFLGTHQDNMRDKVAKQRHPRGERQGSAKLTTADVLDIRARRAAGTPLAVLAAEYGLHRVYVSKVARRVAWRHI